jgi:hypothetical protein
MWPSFSEKQQTWSIANILETFSEINYHVQCFMAFRSNEQGHDLNNGIDCRTKPILRTRVFIRMATNIVVVRFHCLCTKSIPLLLGTVHFIYSNNIAIFKLSMEINK